MASSAQYQQDMTYYAQQRRRLQDKKGEFEAYKTKLQNLKNAISAIPDDINKASSTFLKGGYVDNGKGLDKGKLKQSADRLSQAIKNLSSVISKTQSEINNISREISKADSNYNSAKSAYNRAKAQEEEKKSTN